MKILILMTILILSSCCNSPTEENMSECRNLRTCLAYPDYDMDGGTCHLYKKKVPICVFVEDGLKVVREGTCERLKKKQGIQGYNTQEVFFHDLTALPSLIQLCDFEKGK